MKCTADTFEKALIFSIQSHHGQKRKGDGRPYIMHPLTVMATLYDIKHSSNALLIATAAVLHDVVEDCNVSISTIAKKFGHQVASLVDELTSDKNEISKMGKTEYLKKKMLEMSSYALIIKLCDRYDNVKDLGSLSIDNAIRIANETNDILLFLSDNRKLTKTHKVLINLIDKRIQKTMILNIN